MCLKVLAHWTDSAGQIRYDTLTSLCSNIQFKADLTFAIIFEIHQEFFKPWKQQFSLTYLRGKSFFLSFF